MVFAAIGALVFSPHKRENTEPGAMLLFLSIYNHVQRINREHMALQLALQRDEADAIHCLSFMEAADHSIAKICESW